jgi:hypothetical protein
LQLSSSCDVGEEVSIGTVLGDDKAVRGRLIGLVAFDEIGMVQDFEDFDLVLKHFEA